MKYIKNFKSFTEAHGVPSGILDSAKKFYSDVCSILSPGSNKYKREIQDNTIYISFNLKTEVSINDFRNEDFSVIIEINLDDSIRNPVISSAAIAPNSREDHDNFDIRYGDDGDVFFLMNLYFPNEAFSVSEDLYNFFLNKKSEIISTISHELKHLYDLKHIKKKISMKDMAKYQTTTKLQFGIRELDDFMFYLYFLNEIEIIVKYSEVAGELSALDISKQQFIEHIQKNEVYKLLKTINSWTYSNFRSKLLDKVDYIRGFFKHNGIDLPEMNDNQVIDELESIFLSNIIGSSANTLRNLLHDSNASIYALFSDVRFEDKVSLENKFMDEMKKEMKNYPKYFENKEKFFKFESNKIIRKLLKLYDMLVDEKENKLHSKINAKKVVKNESIKDWDLFQKSNKDKSIITFKKII